jgi:hypothetical protein
MFLTIAAPLLYPSFEIIKPDFNQLVIMIICGFSGLFNIQMIVKLSQTSNVSVVTGIMSGIIIIGTSSFVSSTDYVAFIMIGLSILVLLKIEYIDKTE